MFWSVWAIEMTLTFALVWFLLDHEDVKKEKVLKTHIYILLRMIWFCGCGGRGVHSGISGHFQVEPVCIDLMVSHLPSSPGSSTASKQNQIVPSAEEKCAFTHKTLQTCS